MRKASYIVAATFLLIVGLCPQVRAEIIRLIDTDLYGGDYRDFRGGTLEQCEAACLSDDRCRAFTYNQKHKACFLKEISPSKSHFTGAISGIKSSNRDSTLEDRMSGQPPAARAGVMNRTVLADGTLEIRLQDGSKRRRLPNGRIQTVRPDGTVLQQYKMQVPGIDLPALPSELTSWGNTIEDRLLRILRNILTSDEMEAYLRTEEGKDQTERIDWRTESIVFLTQPSS